ncbi:MAG TPA: DUF305 domain-containing protein [Actinomycetota bacterium]|nr:DUF305 domain-containing protein [Actinomycetota bacterium]
MRRLLVAVALLLTACGGGGENGPLNDADVAFAQGLLLADDHATEVIELVSSHTSRPELTALAEQTLSSRGEEITKVQAWLGRWGKPVEPGAGLDPETQVPPGLLSDEQLNQLDQLKGTGFDLAFVDAFTAHHRGVIELASKELREGSLGEVKALARQVVDGRKAEIDQLAGWKAAWS